MNKVKRQIFTNNFPWKLLRRIVSTLFFVLTCLSVLFILPQQASKHILSFQLEPLILHLTAGVVGWSLASIFVLILVVFGFGRIYCSTICPLGFLQDVAIWLGKIFKIKHNWKIAQKKHLKILRISIFLITVAILLIGSAFMAGLLDPFSIFSRFIFVLKMIFWGTVKGYLLPMFIVSATIITIILLAVKKGRFFCSWLCPVGTMLWGLSKVSLFKFRINQSACNHCGECVVNCKSGAISENAQIIDQALCVGCFNCVAVCNTNAIKIAPQLIRTKPEISTLEINPVKVENQENRRKFLKQFGSVVLVMGTPIGVYAANQLKNSSVEKEKFYRVFPLGATNLKRFANKCIGCMVCAQSCPSGIIKPSIGSFSESPVVPVLDFRNNYCLENCVVCSQVCPTGALDEIQIENKKTTKIASLKLNLKQCQIVAEGLECAICAEICPLNAIEMKQVEGHKHPVPVVILEKCNGCGKCMYRCPVNESEQIFKFTSYEGD
jgi:ferredoxin